MFGIPLEKLLIAGVILSLLGIGLTPSPQEKSVSHITFETSDTTVTLGSTFTIDMVLSSSEPINVFKGTLRFDPNILAVSSIDYNTSLADLWAEEPWYSNGNGTLGFIGGTTRPGGFVGSESILRVTFTGISSGESVLSMEEIRVLRHDGLGTDVMAGKPIDTLFTVSPDVPHTEIIAQSDKSKEKEVFVVPTKEYTDLNGDGKQTISDTSIFMIHFATQNLRSDFNADGVVDIKDMSIFTHG